MYFQRKVLAVELVVIADNASRAVDKYLAENKPADCEVPLWKDGDMRDPDERVVLHHNLEELKRTMWDYVGIVRTTKRLERALNRVENLHREIDEYYWHFKIEPSLIELRNQVQVALLIIRSALARRESRGLHYTLDYPSKLSEIRDTVLKKEVF